MTTKKKQQIPERLWITFEGGLHVGVFTKPDGVEEFNQMRREKRKVDPVTVCFVREPSENTGD